MTKATNMPADRISTPQVDLFAQQTANEPVEQHLFGCKCAKCLAWWKRVGPDRREDGVFYFGPFSQHEIAEALIQDYMKAWKEHYEASRKVQR